MLLKSNESSHMNVNALEMDGDFESKVFKKDLVAVLPNDL